MISKLSNKIPVFCTKEEKISTLTYLVYNKIWVRKIFLKIQTSNKKIIKNFKVDKSENQNDLEAVIKFTKNEIDICFTNM